jgi:hypothetical protein
MKNKELKDLLILLRDYMVENWDDEIKLTCICVACYSMCLSNKITNSQYAMLMEFLDTELPKGKYALLPVPKSRLRGKYIIAKGDDFCWKPFSLKPRINWLNKQIKKLES